MNAETNSLPDQVEIGIAAQPLIGAASEKWKFHKARDSRGNPIRGLWQRNGRYYAALRLPGKRSASRIPLIDEIGSPLRTVAAARDAMQKLRVQRRDNSLSPVGRTCSLAEYIDHYVKWLDEMKPKSALTVAKEKQALRLWREALGAVRLANLRPAHIDHFVTRRKADDGVCNRTLNLDVIALNNCLKRAVTIDRIIPDLPTKQWAPLKHVPPKRPLWSKDKIDLLCAKAAALSQTTGYGRAQPGALEMLPDYIRFLAFSGARRREALHVRWTDLNWDQKLLCFSKTKFGTQRHVNLNPGLEQHLKEMELRRRPDSAFLFPNPARPPGMDYPIAGLEAALRQAREAAGLPDFCFHDLRHYFISTCVMAGIDYMTIARWVGHKDGGVLIGRVYGHLNDAHARQMAAKLAL